MTDSIEGIMTSEVYQVRESETAGQVLRDLALANVSGCPVVGNDGDLVGVISWRDLVRCDPDTQVRHQMSSPSIVAAPDTSLEDAARLMTDGHVHRLIVVNEGKVVGVLSAADVVRAVSSRPRLSLVQAAAIG